MEIKDIEKLAKLSRISLDENEKESFLNEIEPILGYISQLKEVVSGDIKKEVGDHRNITRDDEVLNETGENTDAISDNFPDKDENYLKVKKIL